MTTISSNRQRRRVRTTAVVFFVCVALLILAGIIWKKPASSLVWRVLAPVMRVRNEAAVNNVGLLGLFSSSAQLALENDALRHELASSTVRAMDRDLLYKENLELKQRLNREPSSNKRTLAAVLMRPPGTPYGTLMLDVGKKNGIKEGDLVAAGGSVFIGKISTLYDTTARVTLFTAPGQNYQGQLRGTVPIALAGEGSGFMKGELPTGVSVAVGDQVLLSSFMPEFVAVVTSVVHEEGKSFQTIYLTLPVNPLELRYVEVESSQ